MYGFKEITNNVMQYSFRGTLEASSQQIVCIKVQISAMVLTFGNSSFKNFTGNVTFAKHILFWHSNAKKHFYVVKCSSDSKAIVFGAEGPFLFSILKNSLYCTYFKTNVSLKALYKISANKFINARMYLYM